MTLVGAADEDEGDAAVEVVETTGTVDATRGEGVVVRSPAAF
jgi:hypothetical protein